MRVMQFYHLFSQSGVCEAPVSTLGGPPVPALLPALAVLSPARPGLREQSLGLGTVTEGSRSHGRACAEDGPGRGLHGD